MRCSNLGEKKRNMLCREERGDRWIYGEVMFSFEYGSSIVRLAILCIT